MQMAILGRRFLWGALGTGTPWWRKIHQVAMGIDDRCGSLCWCTEVSLRYKAFVNWKIFQKQICYKYLRSDINLIKHKTRYECNCYTK